ncbi:hypothetical protein ANN_20411 [Periplaneta americana]|uniref:Uncharacterized protein n=1 Tax=Periplaneta americana TaxID=6978 RepID=A0ABQ8SDA1_PERAM|nr:hypothetical protein ANN_20411 [Periplaneta americana]
MSVVPFAKKKYTALSFHGEDLYRIHESRHGPTASYFTLGSVYAPPLPCVAELTHRIISAVAEVTPEVLHRVGEEIDYCHITNESHCLMTVPDLTRS